jgi:hypothetical protein
VAAGGRTFTGTWFSTFSAYVCRLRGYEGARPDESCFVFAPAHKRLDFQAWKMPQHAFYPRYNRTHAHKLAHTHKMRLFWLS